MIEMSSEKNEIEKEWKNELKENKKGIADFMMWFIILFILSIVLIALFYIGGNNIIKDFLLKGLAK